MAILPISRIQAHPLANINLLQNSGFNRFAQNQLISLTNRLLKPCGIENNNNLAKMATNFNLSDDDIILTLNAAITQSETSLLTVERYAKPYVSIYIF